MLNDPLARLGALLLVTAGLGCSTARTVDVLESRLRHQEDMLANYETEMKRVKSELSVTRQEAEGLRLQLADSGQQTVPAEESGALFRAAGIQFSALMTGGTDLDGETGHDGLSVVLVPHDHDGELVKLPGSIELEAFDLATPGGAQRIGHWTYGQRDVHNYWHKGVIQSGYQFELPWQTAPTSEKVLLVGHLSAANGRKFDTTLTVKIEPPPAGLARSANDPAHPDAAPTGEFSAVEQVSGESRGADLIWADREVPTDRRNAPASGAEQEFSGGGSASPGGSSPFFQREPERTGAAPAGTATGAEFSRELNRSSILSAQSHVERQDRPAAALTSGDQRASSPPPPPLEDWWSDDDWATQRAPAPSEKAAVRTSDSFTDETIPRYR